MDDPAKIEPGKLFVGGLAWGTTKESMQAYFEKFGEVSDCVVMKDEVTGNPRGFGFVTFADPESVTKALEIPKMSHILDGKQIDPKLATQKGASKNKCKLFVGGVAPNSTDQTLKAFVTKLFIDGGTNYTVESVELKQDSEGRNKGFGFLEVSEAAGVDFVMANGSNGSGCFYVIDGKKVEFKRANPRGDKGSNQHHGDHSQSVYGQQASSSYYMDSRTSQYPNGSYPLYGSYPTAYSSYPQPAAHQYNYPQYSGRGYSGQQQMGNYSNEVGYNQASSSYSNTDSSYASGMMGYNPQYGGQQPGYNYAAEQPSGNSPSYSRGGMSSQTRGGVSHGYQGYGNR